MKIVSDKVTAELRISIQTQRVSFINFNQLNELFSDQISDLPPPTGSFSLIFKVSFSVI